MIGEKIRSIRKNKNLTIVQLSEQINVTSGYISQIERDLISPSLNVLKRLSDALEVPLSTLFADASTENVIKISENDRTKVKFGNINVELEFITPFMKNNDKGDTLEAFLFKLPPESCVSQESIVHQSKVYIYILRGEINCQIGDNIYNISKGDSICIPEKAAHLLNNSCNEETEAICIISPAVHVL